MFTYIRCKTCRVKAGVYLAGRVFPFDQKQLGWNTLLRLGDDDLRPRSVSFLASYSQDLLDDCCKRSWQPFLWLPHGHDLS